MGGGKKGRKNSKRIHQAHRAERDQESELVMEEPDGYAIKKDRWKWVEV